MDYDSAYNEVRRTIEQIADELDSRLSLAANKVESLGLENEGALDKLERQLQLEKNKVAELQETVANLERMVREKNAAIAGYKNLLAVRCGGIF